MHWRRRRWWLVGVVGFALLIRAALPEVIRRQLETRASELLQARVQVGDVDLGLLGGAVALEDVALRPAVAGGAPAPVEAQPAEPAEPPVVAWRRLAVNLRWWMLARKVVRFSTVELDEPRVALDRLADGGLNLLAFVPAGEAADAPPADEAEKGAPWGVGIDRLVLRAGNVRFRDFAVQEEGSEPVDVRLPTVDVRDVALAPGVYGGPARTSLDVRVDEGRLRVNTRLWLRDGGVALATTLRARRLPLERVRLYVPEVGWRELGGTLGASLVHRLEPRQRNRLTGTVTLDDVTVRVSDVETPALAWKHLGVAIDEIDLMAHRASIDTVELSGATVVVRPQGGTPVPAVARGAGGATPPPAGADAAPPAEPAPPSEPWRWRVGTVRVSDMQAHLFIPDGQHDVALALEVHDLAGDGEQPAATKLTLAMGDATVALEGGTRLAPPGFAGTLTVTDLPLADVTDIAAVLPPKVLQGGTLDASLRLAAGSAAEPAGDVTVAGTVGLERFTLVGDAPELFSVALGELDVAIDELRLPGVLAPPDVARQPPIVKLATMAFAEPSVRLTRTPEGLVLPDLAPPPRTDSESPPARSAAGAPETEPAPADAGAAPSADAASGAAPAPLDVTVGSLRVDDGVVRVSDRTVKPFFTGGLEALDLEVRALRYPALTMEHLELTAKSITRGSLRVTGKRTAAGGRLEVNGKDIALEPFNPYATHYSPYSISGGALSVTSKATIKGGAYDSTTALTLDRFDLGGKEGDSLFKQQFGISLEVALALLRDLQGRIALDISMAGDERGTKVSVMTVAAQALRAALVNALASPLKLVGAAFGGAGGQAAPAPIAFATGRAVPTGDGEKAIAALGGLLASRPGIGITLVAAPTEADARWLAEQALREELSQPQGVFGAIGNLAQRGVRERIRLALEARAEGKEGALEGDDAATLEEWLAERPAPGASQLRALAAARIERVATELREQHGVGPERVAQAEPASEARPGDAVVTFELGAARSRGAS